MNAPARIGDNSAAPSQLRARLEADYAALVATTNDLIDSAEVLPVEITNDDQNSDVADFVKDVKDAAKRIEATREAEKAPFLQGGRDVDGFFKGLTDRLDATAKSLEERVTAYLQHKADEERRRRREEERRAREEAEARRREAEAAEARRLAAEREAAAERRRLEEEARRLAEPAWTREGLETAPGLVADFAAAVRAEEAEIEAERRRVEAEKADAERVEAERRAQAKAADLARTRSYSGGSLSTLKTEWDFEVTDRDGISLEALRPYLAPADVDKAIRLFVKAGGRNLKGVRIFEKTAAVIR